MKLFTLLGFALLALCPAIAWAEVRLPADRWSLADDGGIAWSPKRGDVHADHIEMSGRQVSVITNWGLEKSGHFSASRLVIWPMLRFHPNATRDHLALTFSEDAAPRLFFNRAGPRNETITRISINGILRVEGTYGREGEVSFTRTIFPSVDQPFVYDRTVLTNRSKADLLVEIEPNTRRVDTSAERGIYGAYIATAQVLDAGVRSLKPGESTSFTVFLSARRTSEPAPVAVDAAAAEVQRRERVEAVRREMVLVTPDAVLNTAFAFAKTRATESIYATKGGLMHGPGGGNYYAAIWANDQAEYANPFFAMLGDETARESALNAYRHFARFMNPAYKPLPSSIISEGASTWQGARDRGDAAMIAYGASRFALARGDAAIARELWPLITWCLEFSKRRTTPDGVIASDSDELENRFPSGRANLCTSSLYHDALISSAFLAEQLGEPGTAATAYRREADAVRRAIESHFGRNVEGFETYRYFDKTYPSAQSRHAHYAQEPDHLRAWICIPLTMGLFDRKQGTIDALFSPRLWTADGLATEAGREDFWDRSTLYALRGVLAAGETRRALDYLIYYSHRRLLGEHVPYAIEAWPENNQRHLSAESALYCRIYTEGLFGLRPTGLKRFTLTPRLPEGWPSMALKAVHAFGSTFDVDVTREGAALRVTITRAGEPPMVRSLSPDQTMEVGL